MAENYITRDAEFRELNATIRHYSNLRFLAMPIFFTINGAMLVGIQNEKLRSIPNIFWIIAVFSILLFFFFAAFEWRLHMYLEEFVGHARKLKPGCFWSKRPDRRVYITIILIGMYVAVVSCWFLLAYFYPSVAMLRCSSAAIYES